MAGDVGRKDPDLAVGDLASRARVLAPDPAGRAPLLQEPGFINHQHGVLVGQVFNHIAAHDVTQGIGVPAPAAQDRLLPPGTRIARRLSAHPAGLAALVTQQTIREAAPPKPPPGPA